MAEGGRRGCLVVFDMTDSSQVPVIAEPLFLGANAEVTLAPCMNMDDLEKGLARPTLIRVPVSAIMTARCRGRARACCCTAGPGTASRS